MDRLTLLMLLEKQIQQEINRLEQVDQVDEEQETHRLALYQQLVYSL